MRLRPEFEVGRDRVERVWDASIVLRCGQDVEPDHSTFHLARSISADQEARESRSYRDVETTLCLPTEFEITREVLDNMETSCAQP